MQEFNQIEALWARHTVDIQISADEMLSQAKKELGSIRTKSRFTIVGMVLFFFMEAALWLFFDFNSWTTHAGFSILGIAVGMYTVFLYDNYRIIANSDFTVNPAQFVDQLTRYQLKRHSLYHKLFWFYMMALTLGTFLFSFEILAYMSNTAQIIFWALSLGWIIFCSTIVRKAVIKRDKEKIGVLIEKLQRISQQLTN